jgi:threonyl-tRNA synthetase
LPKKIRNAQLAQFNYIGVVGEEEENNLTIDVRDRDKSERIGKFNID